MPTLQHVHSYVFWKYQGGVKNPETPKEAWYKCADAHCTHTAPRSFILDKASICPKCFSKELILDREALKRKRPLCIDCRNTKEAQQYRKAKVILEELLTEPTETEVELESVRGKADEVRELLDDPGVSNFDSFLEDGDQ